MKPTQKTALTNSLHAEEEAVTERFKKADAILLRQPEAEPVPPVTKIIRDTFTLPQNEHLQLQSLIKRCMTVGISTNKSELIRAGLLALQNLTDAELEALMNSLEKLKVGRRASSKNV